MFDAQTGETRSLQGQALFIFIGVAPRTDVRADRRDRRQVGFILTGADVKVRAWESIATADVRDQRDRNLRGRR
jgi:hypothetical protein